MLTFVLGLESFFVLSGQQAFEQWFSDYFVLLLVPVFATSLPGFIGTIVSMRRADEGSAERRLWLERCSHSARVRHSSGRATQWLTARR